MEHNRVIYERLYDSEVEYLESTGGNAYINTLIAANKISEFTVKIAPVTVQSTFYALGADAGGNTRFSVGYSTINNGSIQIRLGEYYNITNYTLGQFDTITLNRLTGKYYINKTKYTGRIVTNSNTNPNNFVIFRAINNSSLYSQKNTTRIASFSAKGLNGELLLDLIPVRKGSIGYLYDKVSKKLFANKGTGNFILGPDVANPVPNIRRVFRFGNKRFVMPMPYDSKIEYLESTGTQWINTGVIPTRTTHTQVYKSFTRSDQNLGGDGIYNGINIRFHDGIYEGKFHFGIGNSQNWVNTIIADTNKHLFELFGSGYAKLDGTTYNISNGNDTYNREFALFRRIGANEFTGEQIVYCKIYQEDTLVRDFIPVRSGTKGYMYDRVSGKLFGNSGTGQFILGNDIND